MLRVFAIAATFALVLPSLALAQQPPAHGKPAPRAAPRAAPRGPVVHGPVVHGPVVHGPVVRGPAVVVHGGPHAPWMFHGHPYAWHPVHFAHPWVYPSGYAYRLWAVGAILPPLFWAANSPYYYAGWADMGLPPPDPGFQYVQYGPDLLLVNVGTGEVVQVFPGAFS